MDSNYGTSAGGEDLDRDETAALISADKVKGTQVYNDDDEKLGSIDSILIDKVTGEVAYVVMSFGGFLGIGEKFHPLPWHVLEYDTDVGGYRVDLDREMLEGAPAFGREEIDSYDFDTDTRGVNNYYAQDMDVAGGRSADYDDDGEMARRRENHTDAAGNPGFYSAEQQAARNVTDDHTGRNPGLANQNLRDTNAGALGTDNSGGAGGVAGSSSSTGLTGSSTGTADNWTDKTDR